MIVRKICNYSMLLLALSFVTLNTTYGIVHKKREVINGSMYEVNNFSHEDKQKFVNRAFGYINSLKSCVIQFVQETYTGDKRQYAKGAFIIKKPGKMRINYYRPHPLLITSNNQHMYLYDYGMNQLSQSKYDDHPLMLFLGQDQNNHLNVPSHKRVVNGKQKYVVHSCNSYKEIGNSQNADQAVENIMNLQYFNDSVEMTLVFNGNFKVLKRILIRYNQNEQVTIFINSIKHVRKIDDTLFRIKNPSVFGKPSRMTFDQINSLR